MSEEMINLAIIGGGPAGLSAGLYATRGGLDKVVLFEKGMGGGQITNSSEIENYPGVTTVVSGIDFMIPWLEQCFRFGLKQEMVEVSKVEVRDDVYLIHHSNDKVVVAKSVIYAAGGRPRLGGIKGEDKYYGQGIHTCATCDGMFYKNKEVVVLGGGNTALEEALFLAKICTKVYLVHRRDEFRAAPITVAHVYDNPKIEVIVNSGIDEIVGDDSGVTKVIVKNLKDNSIREIEVPGVFEFVGYDLNTAPLSDGSGLIVDTDASGAIVVDLLMATSRPGFFAAGDIRTKASKQVVCAAGDGATAALGAIAYLEHSK